MPEECSRDPFCSACFAACDRLDADGRARGVGADQGADVEGILRPGAKCVQRGILGFGHAVFSPILLGSIFCLCSDCQSQTGTFSTISRPVLKSSFFRAF